MLKINKCQKVQIEGYSLRTIASQIPELSYEGLVLLLIDSAILINSDTISPEYCEENYFFSVYTKEMYSFTSIIYVTEEGKAFLREFLEEEIGLYIDPKSWMNTKFVPED